MGYVNSDIMTVTVNSPPLSGPQTGNVKATEVILSLRQEPMLAKVFRNEAYTIGARTVSIAGSGVAGCMFALDPTANGAISAGGNTSTTLNNCSVHSNSSSSQSINTNGGGLISAAEFNVVGNTAGTGLSTPGQPGPVINSGVQRFAASQVVAFDVPTETFAIAGVGVADASCNGVKVSAAYTPFSFTAGWGIPTYTTNASACYPSALIPAV